MSDTEIAWVAGLLEGEGSFGLCAPRKLKSGETVYCVRITCGMTDEDTILKLRDFVGGGSINPESRRDPRREHSKPLYVWQMSKRDDVAGLFQLIRPWMSQRRGAKIDELIEYERNRPRVYGLPSPHGTYKTWRRGCRCGPCVVAYKERLHELARRKHEEDQD